MRHLVSGRTMAAVALSASIVVSLVATATVTASGGSAARSSGPRHATAAVARTDAAGIEWLCRPGLAHDPCTANLDSTAVPAHGPRTVTRAAPAANSAFDCFYVYPTVSTEQAVNADLKVQKAETDTAVMQASRFSALCNVWAPMYRQTTLRTLGQGVPLSAATADTAYKSVLAGWKDYLAHYNHGRPIIFIAHSQGSSMLMRLLSRQIDSHPKLRRQMVSAILPGGNVEVPTVVGGGGTFRHIPACRSTGQLRCVIAYSTYPSEPPANTVFGRPNTGVSKGQKGQTNAQVLCVNPAALGGGSARLDTYFPASALPAPGARVRTPWVEYPSLYRATCKTAGDATWLQAVRVSTPGDKRPGVAQKAPQIGFHEYDVNLPLGNLVRDVQAQESAYETAMK
jgi:Protein of unknown function (DUF3089)